MFFIPPETCPLYQAGSHVLGYDVRERRDLDSPWDACIGAARDFGLHLTLCDALYFFNEAEARKAIQEVKYLAGDCEPFDLTDLTLRSQFPDDSSLAIGVKDPSRCLETIHCELVQRVYRRATASNYSLGLARLSRGETHDRGEWFMERYHAPYVLKRFKPHFTLMNNVPVAECETRYREVKELLDSNVFGKTITVDRLAVMSRSPKDGRWFIDQEIRLGRT